MATFNAGTIDATLTLDRSAFTRELLEARNQAENFERNGIQLQVDLLTGGEFEQLRIEIERLDAAGINISAKIEDLTEEFVYIKEYIEYLDEQSIDLHVRFHNSRAEFVRIQSEIEALEGQTINIGLRVGGSRLEFTRIRNLIEDLDGEIIDIGIRLTGSRSEFVRLQNTINTLDGQTIHIDVDVDDDGKLAALAGAIEALRAGTATPLTVNVDVDNTQLAPLAVELEKFDTDIIRARIQVIADQAIDELAALEAQMLAVETVDPTVNVDVDAGAASAELALIEAQAEALDGKDVDIDVNVSERGFTAFSGSVTRMEAIISGLLLLAPLVPAALAPAAAAVVALGSALTAAAGAVGVLGLGVGGVTLEYFKLKQELTANNEALAESEAAYKDELRSLQGMKEGSEEYKAQLEQVSEAKAAYREQLALTNTQQQEMNDKFGAAEEAMGGLQSAWGDFLDAVRPQVVVLMAQALRIVADLLPKLAPLFGTFGNVAQKALNGVAAFMDSKEGQRMLTFFEDIGSQSLDSLLQIIGNLLKFFGRLFEAFGPFALEMLRGLDRITEGWAKWANQLRRSEGFKEFLDYARDVGPQVIDLVKSLFDALVAIGKALAPLAEPAIAVFKAIFDGIAALPTPVLTALITLFGGLFLAVQALTAIGQAYRATMIAVGVAMNIVRAAQIAWTAVVWAFNAAWAANPLGLIVLAIAAVVAGLVWAYQHFEGFRKVVDAVVGAIVDAFQWLWDVLFGNSIIPDIVEAMKIAWDVIMKIISVAVDFITAYVKAGFWVVQNVILPALKAIWAAVQFYFKAVYTVVSTYVKLWVAVIKVAWGIITNYVIPVLKKYWDFVKTAFKAIWTVIKTYVGLVVKVVKTEWALIQKFIINPIRKAWEIVRNVFTAIKKVVVDRIVAVVQFIREAWNNIADKIKLGMATIRGLIKAGWDFIRGVFNAAKDRIVEVAKAMWDRVVEIVRGAIDRFLEVVRGIAEKVGNAVKDAGTWLFDAGKAVIQGLIDGIKEMLGPLGDALDVAAGMIPDWFPGSPAKKGPLAQHGGYHMKYAGGQLIAQLVEGLGDDKNLGRALGGITNKIAATSGAISASIDTGGKMAAVAGGGAGTHMEINIINPSRQRVTESYDRALKDVAYVRGYQR